MDPKDFKRWRKNLKLSQKDAAEVLGLKPRMVQYYEKGERDGKKVNIPKAVSLACHAIVIQRMEREDETLFEDLTNFAHKRHISADKLMADVLRGYLKTHD